jgi:hypothetical protein
MFAACKKNLYDNITPLPPQDVKSLNEKEKEVVAKFEHASFVLQAVFSEDKNLRKEFNGFIAAKLAKSGTDEELTFKEIFEANPVVLAGVKSDFLVRFRESFARTFINGDFPNSSKFNSIDEVAAYYDVKPSSGSEISLFELAENQTIPHEIYFPYSENWNPISEINYAVTYHPLNNVEWNYGMFFDAWGQPLYEETVNDDFA